MPVLLFSSFFFKHDLFIIQLYFNATAVYGTTVTLWYNTKDTAIQTKHKDYYRNQNKIQKMIRKGSRALLVLLWTKVLHFCHKNVTNLSISMTNTLQKRPFYDNGRWEEDRISKSRKYSSAHNLYLCHHHPRHHCIRVPWPDPADNVMDRGDR